MLIGAARLGARLLSISAASRSGSARLMSTTFVLDKFCIRQFDDPEYTGTRIEFEKAAFAQTINEMYDSGKCSLVDGYAPFCKHLFVPNFVKAKENYLAITPENEGLMRSGYDARTELELPVLVRWFPLETAPEPPECVSWSRSAKLWVAPSVLPSLPALLAHPEVGGSRTRSAGLPFWM